jgi:hypothetical protein
MTPAPASTSTAKPAPWPQDYTYAEAGIALGLNVRTIRNLMHLHALPRTYRRFGRNPRRHALISERTLQRLVKRNL